MIVSTMTGQSGEMKRFASMTQTISALPVALRVLGLSLIAFFLALGFVRLIPIFLLDHLSQFIGRPAPDLLLLAITTFLLMALMVLMLQMFHLSAREPSDTLDDTADKNMSDVLGVHFQIDQAIDNKLIEVIEDTENSALAIIKDVRGLYDSANTLVNYLQRSSLSTNSLDGEIVDSVNRLGEISIFIERLPEKMAREMESVQSVVKEIKELNSLVAAVSAISMQSHLLAINAAIEASRSGPAGAAFRAVATEMRSLASNTTEVASKINQGLARARSVVEDGMSASIAESGEQLESVTQAVLSIKKLQENFEDISQYYKTRFTVVAKHNKNLADDIAATLGQIQYQDVVRQCIERMRIATEQRNALLASAAQSCKQTDPELAALIASLEAVLQDYMAEEDKHKHSARHSVDDGSEMKIELF